MQEIHKKIQSFINEAQSILITSHIDPDGDSLGSILALYNYIGSLNKKVVILIEGDIPEKYRALPGVKDITNIKNYKKNGKFDLAIVLECPNIKRSGSVKQFLNNDVKIINIDHHPDNEHYGDVEYINDGAAAVGEILTEYFMDIDFNIDSDTASVLYAAIMTDTGRFRFSSTTRRTMEIAGVLIEKGANPRKICDEIYLSLSEEVLKLAGYVLSNMELFENGQICLVALDESRLKNQNGPVDTEGMAEFTLYGKDVRVGGFLREINNSCTKVSLRSRESINVSELAHKYGGGGHVNASGYVVDLSINDARERLLKELREIVNGSV